MTRRILSAAMVFMAVGGPGCTVATGDDLGPTLDPDSAPEIASDEDDPFQAKSHLEWTGPTNDNVIAIDIGYDGVSDLVFTWLYENEFDPTPEPDPDNNTAWRCKGTSTNLCPNFPVEVDTCVDKRMIQAIAIAKNTQRVYSWYTAPGSTTTRRMIGTVDHLCRYDIGDIINADFATGEIIDAAVATNGNTFYYRTVGNAVRRYIGNSGFPCAVDCSDFVTSTRSGHGDDILGIAFNHVGAQHTWYTKISSNAELNTGTATLVLW
jgi:hypothetical protein